MIRRRWQILIVLSALLVLGGALAWMLGPRRGSAEAFALAQRAAQAQETVAVRGIVRTLVLTPRGPVEARAEMHRGADRVYIRYLNGPTAGMEVYRDDGTVWSHGPEGAAYHRTQIADGDWSHELMRRNWRVRLGGERRIAGRPAVLLTARGPGGRLTIVADRETGFPLVLKRSSPNGRLLSETVWETVDFSVGPPPPQEPPSDAHVIQYGRRRVTVEEAQRAVDFTLLAPTRVPRGFTLEGWFLRERRRGVAVEARYTDGLRPLLVIEQKARDAAGGGDLDRPERPRPEGPRRGADSAPTGAGHPRKRGPMQDGPMMRGRDMKMRHGPMMHLRGAGGRALRREIDGVLVTVIGPDLGDELADVLESMAPVGPTDPA